MGECSKQRHRETDKRHTDLHRSSKDLQRGGYCKETRFILNMLLFTAICSSERSQQHAKRVFLPQFASVGIDPLL